MAAGNSFIVSGPPKLAVIWFGDNERALCTTIGSLAGAVGSIFGYLLPIFYFSKYDIDIEHTWEEETKLKAKAEFSYYIFIQSIFCTALSLPIVLLI